MLEGRSGGESRARGCVITLILATSLTVAMNLASQLPSGSLPFGFSSTSTAPAASGVGLASVTGSGTATIQLEDLERADCVFVIGGNPASNHPRLMRTLLHVRRRGGQVIIINPIVETGLVASRTFSNESIAVESASINLSGNTQLIGKALYTQYALPFEITSVLLLVAIVGAIVMAKKEL